MSPLFSKSAQSADSSAPRTPRPAKLSTGRRALMVAGALVVAGTWSYLVLLRPTDWESVAGRPEAFITLAGYLGGAALLLAGALPSLTAGAIALIPVCLVINIAIGELIGSIGVPLYLDSLGTVLMAALLGPVAGLATGTLSSVVWGFINPAALPFAAVSAATGWMAGWAIQRGVLQSIWRIVVSGAIIGIISGMLAAPVAAFVYGGTAGLGTGALVSVFREFGNSLLASVTMQSLVSDPLDKIVVLFFVALTVKALPQRVLKRLHPAVHPRPDAETKF